MSGSRICLAIVASLGATALPAATPTSEFRTVPPEQIVWQPVPDSFGVESALLSGDPSKPGTYVIRVRFPPHVMDRPHSHSGDRYVTVVKGVWSAGTGPGFDPAKAVQLKAGSFMFHPAGGVHWDGSNSNEEAVVQIIGQGPVSSTNLDSKLPSWVRVEN